MEYYLSAPETIFKPVREQLLSDGVSRNYLLSFATSSRHFAQFYQDGKNQIMIDSGAFSAWNSGKVIDFDEYAAYLRTMPDEVFKINLDVIPQTNSSRQEKDECVVKSFNNFVKLNSMFKNVLPVHHYGEDVIWAKRMLELTDYICISPANDTHENIKREYFGYIFSELPEGVKTHVLGYSSMDGVEIYPFFSLDSISYKKTHMHGQVFYTRSDGRVINIEINEFAKMHGYTYNPSIGLSEQPDLLHHATYETINNMIKHFENVTWRHLTKDFSFIKQQLKLF